MEWRSRPSALLLSACVLAVFTFLYLVPLSGNNSGPTYNVEQKDAFKAPKHNIWAELSEAEANDVYEYIFEQLPELNLTRHPKSNRESFIFILETLHPNKTDAAPYLYLKGDVPKRWAKASIAQNVDGTPLMTYYSQSSVPPY